MLSLDVPFAKRITRFYKHTCSLPFILCLLARLLPNGRMVPWGAYLWEQVTKFWNEKPKWVTNLEQGYSPLLSRNFDPGGRLNNEKIK